VISYGGKTIPRWRTAANLKIVISPYLSEKASDFDEILYTEADFELDERHVIKNEEIALDRLRVRQNVFLVYHGVVIIVFFAVDVDACLIVLDLKILVLAFVFVFKFLCKQYWIRH